MHVRQTDRQRAEGRAERWDAAMMERLMELRHFFASDGGAPFWAQLLFVLVTGGLSGTLIAMAIWGARWTRGALGAAFFVFGVATILVTRT
jgi:hypothetical protein